MKKERCQEYEIYNHRVLWCIAEKNLNSATSSDSAAERLQYSLGAMLLFLFAFEGYLNWLGDRIASDIWQNERNFFSKDAYKGTLGKYRFLTEALGLPVPDPSQGSFQTVKDVLKLRDWAVHPKAEKGERTVKYEDGYFPPLYRGRLVDRVSPEKASRTREHVRQLVEELHQKARVLHTAAVCEQHAFEGMLGITSTDG